MENTRETHARKLHYPVNVPVVIPKISAYTAALHMSFMALVLVASIFVIAIATFNSANAFSIDQNSAIVGSLEYNRRGNDVQKLGLVADQSKKRILPNVEETAFNSVIFSKGISRVQQITTNEVPPIALHQTGDQSKKTGTSLSSTTRYITAAGLLGMLALMIWITARMWREFAGGNSQ